MNNIIASIVMPLYNEEKYIGECIESLLRQDYDKTKMEWIFVDGRSSDKTVEIINSYKEKYKELIKILNNDMKTVPYAMNIGIKNAKGKYIIRLDAHAKYEDDYISKCVETLDTVDADNVGGIAKTLSKTKYGSIIAKALSCKFGVGNSRFRTEKVSAYVDTVPFGAFRREVFEKYGYYDERLIRNQDNEMNYRIRKNGGKIYMSKDIKLTYYSRDTLSGILDMAFKNGKWNIITSYLVPNTMGLRHFIPFIFVLSLIIMPILAVFSKYFLYLFMAELFMYTLCDIYYSVKQSANFYEFINMIYIFPLFHIFYGCGSIAGILELRKFRKVK